ncbi:hypothetical protein BH20GEM1_BH20GEM1_18060 [soil metagenome]
MKKSSIGEEDLRGAVRRHGRTLSLDDVRAAFLERNGDISVVLDR